MQPVFRLERSRGWVLGTVGNDAASSAQSKCVGGGETARFGGVWGEQGCTGGIGAIDDERGVSTGAGGVISDAAVV